MGSRCLWLQALISETGGGDNPPVNPCNRGRDSDELTRGGRKVETMATKAHERRLAQVGIIHRLAEAVLKAEEKGRTVILTRDADDREGERVIIRALSSDERETVDCQLSTDGIKVFRQWAGLE